MSHNNSLLLSWVIPIFDEQLNSFNEQWNIYYSSNMGGLAPNLTKEYQELVSVTIMVNLSQFDELLRALSELSKHIYDLSQNQDKNTSIDFGYLIQTIKSATQILQSELKNYNDTSSYHYRLIANSVIDIIRLIPDSKLVLSNQEAITLNTDDICDLVEIVCNESHFLELSDIEKNKLVSAWKFHISKLIEENSNQSTSILQLSKISHFLWRGCTHNHLLQKVWYLVNIWFSCLPNNKSPQPEYYLLLIKELSNMLDMTFQKESDDDFNKNNAYYNSIVADLFIQLERLVHTNVKAKELTSKLQSDDNNFFSKILHDLETIIFKIDNPKKILSLLKEIEQKLVTRGWSSYASQISGVISEVSVGIEYEEIYEQTKWQVERLLQNLYGEILITKDTIHDNINQDFDNKMILDETQEFKSIRLDASQKMNKLRQIRIILEEVKKSFNQYVHTNNVDKLPEKAILDGMILILSEINLADVNTVVNNLSMLIERIRESRLKSISWVVAGSTADSISEFELFLDYLAQQAFDDERLQKTLDRISEANSNLDRVLDSSLVDDELENVNLTIDNSVLRYDDSGEIQPHNDSLDITANIELETSSAVESEVLVSEELQKARDALPADSFDMDEDIREIFIEEAGEVLEEMEVSLPAWSNNPDDLNSLKDIRRGFHTLKGSGRMVGANNVGEMSWAVENMLNRVLENTVELTPELVSFISETKEKIPTLVSDYKQERLASMDPAITIVQANNLLAGRDINTGLSITPAVIVEEELLSNTDSIKEVNEDAIHTADSATQVSNKVDEEYHTDIDSNKDEALPTVLLPFFEEAQLMPFDKLTVDDDIKEIFIEEAQEVLEDTTPVFFEWSRDVDNENLLTDIRRGFHTLKGSGRMVGANYSGELAWSVENLLNRVLDKSVEVSSDIIKFVTDVLSTYPSIIDALETGDNNYPNTIPFLYAIANAYSQNIGHSFDYQRVADSYRDNQGNGLLIDSNTTEIVDTVKVETSQQIFESIQTVNQQLLENPDVTTINSSEQEFVDIFMVEARERLQIIESFVEKNKDADTVVVDDNVVRAFHTLRGASGADSLTAISEVSASIEKSLIQLQKHDAPMTSQHMKVISQSAILISEHLDEFVGLDKRQPTKDMQEIQSFLAESNNNSGSTDSTSDINVLNLMNCDIDLLLDAENDATEFLTNTDERAVVAYSTEIIKQISRLKDNTKQSAKFQSILNSLLSVYQLMLEKPNLEKDSDFVSALISGHEQVTGLFDSLAGSLSLSINQQVIDDIDNIVSANYSSTSDPLLKNSIELPTSLQANTSTNLVTEPQEKLAVVNNLNDYVDSDVELEDVHTDAELLEIFLEEARELEEDITRSFGAWKENPVDMEALKELQRYLHTIKGGARMSGISSIGDLTHEIETIYEKFVNKDMIPTQPWLNIMQSAQDVLSMQIEFVATNNKSFFTKGLIKQLLEFASLDALPEHAILTLPSIVNNKKIATAPVVEQNDIEDNAHDKHFDKMDANYNEMVDQSWEYGRPDSDILDVYLEEADELIESTVINLESISNNTSDMSNLSELQRELHTIKGGARMVNASGIAELSHEMENIYEDLASRRLPATKKCIQLLTRCHDWLANAIYVLKHNINPPSPVELVQALRSFHKNPDNLQDIPSSSLQEYINAIEELEAYKKQMKGDHDITEMPPLVGNFGDFEDKTDVSNEMIRVSSSLMEDMINLSGESAINRARVDMGVTSLTQSIEEMGITVQRLADQLRRMDIELEAQVMAQVQDSGLLESAEDFDPLEMDQYSSLNQLSKSLSESASDLLDIKTTMIEKTRDSENLLLQLSRTQNELQDGLMNSRMVPFSRLTPRLQRIVRQTANEVNKQVELSFINADDEIDRTILDRVTSPLEHMIRNAVDHGIETPSEREKHGKAIVGQVSLEILREGSELLIKLSDDGHGVDVEAVRNKAIKQGLIDPNDSSLTDSDIMQYIFNAGLSTTKKVTQISGRGVGMDVVRSEVRQLGGSVSVDSKKGNGSVFTMRVPLTVAMSDALIVRIADRQFAIPLIQIDRVEQVNSELLHSYYQSNQHTLEISGVNYRLRYLNEILTGNQINDLTISTNNSLPIIIVKNSTGQNLALQVDEIVSSRIELVVKPLAKQLSTVSGISSATIMGDGSVLMILDLLAVIRDAPARIVTSSTNIVASKTKKILVVDDSVTVRKVTSRFLDREGFETHVARDGIDAMETLQDLTPDLILLDIEMPRMDGFEVATQVRFNSRLKDIPIIMITSRTGDKHRERAMDIGVNDYLGKPFQEKILLERIGKLI